MAGVTIVFEDDFSLGLDATLSQKHDREAEVTEHEVEDGADISDHIRQKPAELSLSAIQVVSPLRSLLEAAMALIAPGGGLGADHHVASYEKLLKAFEKGELVTVHTGLKVYEDMAIVSMQVAKDSPTFDLPLSLSFRQIRKVQAKLVKIPKDALGKALPTAVTKVAQKAQVAKTQAQAVPKVAKGPVAKAAVTAPQAAKSSSVLYKITGTLVR